MENRRASDAVLAEIATDIKYIKKSIDEHKEDISILKEWKLKWEGFKWAWALMFVGVGSFIKMAFDWIMSGKH